MALNSYRELKVWQLGMEIARDVYVLTQGFPKHEVYGLSSQMQRSAVSVPANILLAASLNYTKPNQVTRLLDKCAEQRKMLSGLRRSLRTRLKP